MTEGIAQKSSPESHLARRLGLFDTTMIVMGGIIGSGIFINPYVVAQQVPSTTLILGAWAVGGLIALVVPALGEARAKKIVDLGWKLDETKRVDDLLAACLMK